MIVAIVLAIAVVVIVVVLVAGRHGTTPAPSLTTRGATPTPVST